MNKLSFRCGFLVFIIKIQLAADFIIFWPHSLTRNAFVANNFECLKKKIVAHGSLAFSKTKKLKYMFCITIIINPFRENKIPAMPTIRCYAMLWPCLIHSHVLIWKLLIFFFSFSVFCVLNNYVMFEIHSFFFFFMCVNNNHLVNGQRLAKVIGFLFSFFKPEIRNYWFYEPFLNLISFLLLL